jgi:hypothetical protein
MTDHILLELISYIDLWLNTRLVHDLYLKIMEGHFSMIDCEKLSFKSLCKFSFCINKLFQVATLARPWMFLCRGFTTSKHWCVDL